MQDIFFITSNSHKLAEARAILKKHNILQTNLESDEIQGDIEKISINKTLNAFNKVKKNCFTEDTSLIFDAWGKLPGPYIKYFLETIGPSGLYKSLKPFDNNKAYAICTVGLMNDNFDKPLLFQGKVTGKIVSPRGDSGFEWDKIFVPDGYDKTFAELGMEIKNQISHRKKALTLLNNFLEKLNF